MASNSLWGTTDAHDKDPTLVTEDLRKRINKHVRTNRSFIFDWIHVTFPQMSRSFQSWTIQRRVAGLALGHESYQTDAFPITFPPKPVAMTFRFDVCLNFMVSDGEWEWDFPGIDVYSQRWCVEPMSHLLWLRVSYAEHLCHPSWTNVLCNGNTPSQFLESANEGFLTKRLLTPINLEVVWFVELRNCYAQTMLMF
jgi:hypothetical protein